MGELVPDQASYNYLNIVQGKLRKKVDAETEGAKRREYETKDGNKGVKYELVYKQISGKIKDVWIAPGDFGEQLHVSIDIGKERYVLNMPSSGRYAQDFLKRLPGVNLAHEVELKPYDIEAENGKRNTGVKITDIDTGKVVSNFFYDSEEKKVVNGFPEPESDQMDGDDWKMYFLRVGKFLKRVLEEKVRPELNELNSNPKMPAATSSEPGEKAIEVKDDLPF